MLSEGRGGVMARLAAACLAATLLSLAALPASAQQWLQTDTIVGTGQTAVVNLAEGKRLRVNCQGDRIFFRLGLPYRLRGGREAVVEITLPDREPVIQSWQRTAGGQRLVLVAPLPLARHLIAGRAPTLAHTTRRGERITISVPVEGAAAALSPAIFDCGLSPSNLEVILPEVDIGSSKSLIS